MDGTTLGFVLMFGSTFAVAFAMAIVMWLDEHQWIVDKWNRTFHRSYER